MKYVIITKDWADSKGLVISPIMRTNKDSTKVVIHYDFIKPLLSENDDVQVYEHNNQEFINILNSDEWNYSENNE